ncbi:MAG: LD-carboxypeptidase [Chthoniobacterales bacterium]|nr:LD-carboxypeptidase [Chthoniobacterales bacterium]
MKKIFPKKLKIGDGIRVVAPARSLAMPLINEGLKEIAQTRFKELGLHLSFAKHVNEIDAFDSSSMEHRRDDFHEAFSDQSIKMVITVIGGFNSNQLLRYLDYDLIKKNPKIFCGYSDITALGNAVFAKTGLVTYSGPHFFSFGEKNGFDHTLEYFKRCVMNEDSFEVLPSKQWSDGRWANNQDDRKFVSNEGYWVINEGSAKGTLIGGNQCTLNLLQGTEFMPALTDAVLFLEDDDEAHAATIDRDLQSLIHLSDFAKVQGIVFGRFTPKTGMTQELLTKIVKTKKELDHLPVIANVDFGHTTPFITFPIGGEIELVAKESSSSIKIIRH